MLTIEPTEAYQRAQADSNCVIIDVRETFECRERIPGAIQIPMSKLAKEANGLLPKKELYFLCVSGGRSGMAAELLRSKGHLAAFSIRGGIISWESASLPLIDS